MLGGCPSDPQENNTTPSQLPAPELRKMSYEQYGLDVKGSSVLQAYLEEGQYMTDLLQEHGVPGALIDSIEVRSQAVFDVRRMRAGRPITIIKSNLSKEVQYFVYEKTDASFVVFDLREGVKVFEGNKKVRLREKEIGGIITGSLYSSIEEAGLDRNLSARLEEIFRWTVDFRDLDKGDFFKVVYEEQLVDGAVVGIGKILAAQVRQQGQDYHAFFFDRDSLRDFYDLEGKSLNSQFLESPLGPTLPDGVTMRQHRYGNDYLTEVGTEVQATADGQVVDLGRTDRRGKYITLRHNGLFSTQYLFLRDPLEGLSKGQTVYKGQVIGYSGRHPEFKRPMFRYRFFQSGKAIDPRKVEIPSGLTLTGAELIHFNRVTRLLKARLEGIGLRSGTAQSRQTAMVDW